MASKGQKYKQCSSDTKEIIKKKTISHFYRIRMRQ